MVLDVRRRAIARDFRRRASCSSMTAAPPLESAGSMKRIPPRIVLVLAASLVGSHCARAQTNPPAPTATLDADFAAQKSTFMTLPEDIRKGLQDALVWLGFYNGVNDGDFGKRTRDSIVAWQRSVKATPDRVLGPTLVQALMAAADKAR